MAARVLSAWMELEALYDAKQGVPRGLPAAERRVEELERQLLEARAKLELMRWNSMAQAPTPYRNSGLLRLTTAPDGSLVPAPVSHTPVSLVVAAAVSCPSAAADALKLLEGGVWVRKHNRQGDPELRLVWHGLGEAGGDEVKPLMLFVDEYKRTPDIAKGLPVSQISSVVAGRNEDVVGSRGMFGRNKQRRASDALGDPQRSPSEASTTPTPRRRSSVAWTGGGGERFIHVVVSEDGCSTNGEEGKGGASSGPPKRRGGGGHYSRTTLDMELESEEVRDKVVEALSVLVRFHKQIRQQ